MGLVVLDQKNLLSLPGFEPPDRPGCNLVSIPTELSGLVRSAGRTVENRDFTECASTCVADPVGVWDSSSSSDVTASAGAFCLVSVTVFTCQWSGFVRRRGGTCCVHLQRSGGCFGRHGPAKCGMTRRRNAGDDHLVTVVFPSGQGSQSKDRLVVSNFVCPNSHQISASGNSSHTNVVKLATFCEALSGKQPCKCNKTHLLHLHG